MSRSSYIFWIVGTAVATAFLFGFYLRYELSQEVTAVSRKSIGGKENIVSIEEVEHQNVGREESLGLKSDEKIFVDVEEYDFLEAIEIPRDVHLDVAKTFGVPGDELLPIKVNAGLLDLLEEQDSFILDLADLSVKMYIDNITKVDGYTTLSGHYADDSPGYAFSVTYSGSNSAYGSIVLPDDHFSLFTSKGYTFLSRKLRSLSSPEE